MSGKGARTMTLFPGWIWIVFPGCWALIGPHEARGPMGGQISVQCWYARGFESYIKYWCRGAVRSSCHMAVQTSESKATEKKGRVSIRDIHTFCMFMVTMTNVTEGDSGIYWCGIERLGLDLMFPVKVSILPAVPTSPTPAPEREPTVDTASTESLFTWTVPEVTESNTTIHNSDPPARTTNPALHILLPCLLLVLLLILVTAVVFIKTSQRRNKALEGAPGQGEKNPYRLVTGNAPDFVSSALAASSEGAICAKTEKTTDSADAETIYENSMQNDAGFRMDRKDCSRHSDISNLTYTYANLKPKTRSRTPPSHGQPKHGKKATG